MELLAQTLKEVHIIERQIPVQHNLVGGPLEEHVYIVSLDMIQGVLETIICF
jgi:hypothetical protein